MTLSIPQYLRKLKSHAHSMNAELFGTKNCTNMNTYINVEILSYKTGVKRKN